MTNSSEWLQLYQEAWENDGNTGVPTGLPGGMTWTDAQKYNTDWWDEVTRDRLQTGIQSGCKLWNCQKPDCPFRRFIYK